MAAHASAGCGCSKASLLLQNIFNLLAAILTSTAAPENSMSYEFKAKDNKSASLVDNLRRQLMKDNYDYMTDESTHVPARPAKSLRYGEGLGERERVAEEPPSPRDEEYAYTRATVDIPRGYHKQYVRSDNYSTNNTRSQPDRDRRKPPMFHNNSKYLVPIENRIKLATAGTEKAIYDYEDTKVRRRHDDSFVPREAEQASEEPAHVAPRDAAADGNSSASAPARAVQYSVLKVNAGGRRSMSAPRLLKEEKPDEVSIVNLGEGPLPQFQLPDGRRQYMRELPEHPLRAHELPDAAPVDLE